MTWVFMHLNPTASLIHKFDLRFFNFRKFKWILSIFSYRYLPVLPSFWFSLINFSYVWNIIWFIWTLSILPFVLLSHLGTIKYWTRLIINKRQPTATRILFILRFQLTSRYATLKYMPLVVLHGIIVHDSQLQFVYWLGLDYSSSILRGAYSFWT